MRFTDHGPLKKKDAKLDSINADNEQKLDAGHIVLSIKSLTVLDVLSRFKYVCFSVFIQPNLYICPL